MKNPAGLIVTVLIIVIPIVWCCISLININKEYEEDAMKMKDMTENINHVIDPVGQSGQVLNHSGDTNSSGDIYTSTIGGETYESPIGKPIGKIVEGATINVSSANVYTSPDESSSIAGTVNKNTEVTALDFPDGWSMVKVKTLSGWMRTEYITKTAGTGDVSLGSVIGKTAVVNVDSLNVRESPVTGATKTQLINGTEVKILDVNSDKTWYYIQWREIDGWISANYVDVNY